MRSMKVAVLVLTINILLLAATACSEEVPGVVINYIPASSQIYIGAGAKGTFYFLKK